MTNLIFENVTSKADKGKSEHTVSLGLLHKS